MVEASNVAQTMSITLVLSIVIDFGSAYLGWRIPWYATTSVLTLFMYACESSANYHDRVELQEWRGKVEAKLPVSS